MVGSATAEESCNHKNKREKKGEKCLHFSSSRKSDCKRPWKLLSLAAGCIGHISASPIENVTSWVQSYAGCILCISKLYITKFWKFFAVVMVFLIGVIVWSIDIFLLLILNVTFLPVNQLGIGRWFLGMIICHSSASVVAVGEVLSLAGLMWAVAPKRSLCSNT